MADVNVFIKLNGVTAIYDPPLPVVKRGDTVVFHSFLDGNAALFIAEGGIFGTTKFIIPPGHNLRLIVQDFMPGGAGANQVNCHVEYFAPGAAEPAPPANLAAGPVTPLGLKPNPPD